MSTLDGPIWSRCGIALTYPARSYFQCTLNRNRQARVEMNVATHQEEKNEKTRMGERELGEGRRQATDFKEVACCPSAIVQGVAW